MFKQLEEWLNLCRDTEYMKKYPSRTFRGENYNIWDEKYTVCEERQIRDRRRKVYQIWRHNNRNYTKQISSKVYCILVRSKFCLPLVKDLKSLHVSQSRRRVKWTKVMDRHKRNVHLELTNGQSLFITYLTRVPFNSHKKALFGMLVKIWVLCL